MRKHILLYPAVALAMLLVLPMGPADAAQVITDEIRQWARQAVSEEAAMDLKPAADTVAVLYFQNQSERPDLDFLQKGMTVMLISDLAKIEGLQVVERSRLQALMQEMKMADAGIVADDTAPRLGQMMGAGYLVGGQFLAGMADNFNIDANLLDVPGEDILGSPSSSGLLNDLIRMEKDVLFELVRLLRIELTDAQKAELSKPITTKIKALMYLVRGIDSSDQGDYAQAADYYQQALEEDPELEAAESALSELKALGLLPYGSGTGPLLRKLRNRVSVNTGPVPNHVTRRHKSEAASVQGPAGAGNVDVRLQW